MLILNEIITSTEYLPYKTVTRHQRTVNGISATGFTRRKYEVTVAKLVDAIEWFYQKSVSAKDVYLRLLELGFIIYPHWQDWQESAVYAEWLKKPLGENSLFWECLV